MENKNILDFYKKAVEEGKFKADFIQQLKGLSSIDGLRDFIKEKVCPIAESMGYDFTVDELLSYEVDTAKKLSEEELENITGGVSLKHFILGGAMALVTLGGGALLSSTTHAVMPADIAPNNQALATTVVQLESGQAVARGAENLAATVAQSESGRAVAGGTGNLAATAAKSERDQAVAKDSNNLAATAAAATAAQSESSQNKDESGDTAKSSLQELQNAEIESFKSEIAQRLRSNMSWGGLLL